MLRLLSLPGTLLLMIHGRTIIGIQYVAITYISNFIKSCINTETEALLGTLLVMVHGKTIIGIQNVAITYISNFIKSCISTETEVTTGYIVADDTW